MAKTGIVDRYDGEVRQLLYRHCIIQAIIALMPNMRTALDFGCGTGIHVMTLREYGIVAHGLEIGDMSYRHRRAEPGHMHRLDITRDLRDLLRPVDMAMSIEVGEHLRDKDVDGYAANLRGLAKSLIVMTASHEDGEFHINPQPADYWMDKMTKGGEFKFCPEESTKLQDYFKSVIMPPTTLRWFKHRLWIFRRTKP